MACPFEQVANAPTRIVRGVDFEALVQSNTITLDQVRGNRTLTWLTNPCTVFSQACKMMKYFEDVSSSWTAVEEAEINVGPPLSPTYVMLWAF